MKHESHLKENDRADLERASCLTLEGKELRRRVFARLRARAFRAARPNMEDE